MNRKSSIRLFPATILSLGVALMLGVNLGIIGNEVRAQEPTTPTSQLPKLSLVPLVIENVGLDNLAQPVTSPTGASRPTPEFFLPRNATKEFSVATSGGNITVRFSNSVPAGVSASSFQWEQSEVPAGNAIGRLRYSGCPSCPATFTIEIGASSRETVHTVVKINLTTSTGRPAVTSITRNGDTNDGQPRFEIRFQRGTFDPADSQVVATYPSGLKYRLIPETSSQFANGDMNVPVPRLEVGRSIKIALVNPFGSSGNSTITLPEQLAENPPFVQVNSSNVSPDPAQVTGNPNFSVRHGNISLLAATGSDDITIQPLATTSSCNKADFIYQGAKATWLDDQNRPTTTLGTVTIGSQPPTNALLRSPNNRVHVNFTLNAGFNGDKFYQVAFIGVTVVGVCNDRIIH